MMDKYKLFKNSVKKAAERFRAVDRKEHIRVVSHLDADGISAVSILIKALDKENIKYSISIVQQLDAAVLRKLADDSHNTYIFTDLGSGQINDIAAVLKDKEVIVLDHHDIDPSYNDEMNKSNNLTFVNPHLFGIDGGIEISGAGIVYLFAKEIDDSNKEMAHIAVVGAIGDVQESRGFMKLNSEILQDAIDLGLIKIKEGLRVFGSQTRPLHKTLEYCNDPFIPGVSGSESNAIEFLYQIGINPKNGKEWKKMAELTEEEVKKLIAAVIVKRINEENPDDVLGYSYIINSEEEGSPLRDAKEFATLLNACGRLDKASLGIGACIGDEKLKKKAVQHQQEYKREIMRAMNWYRDNKKEGLIEKGRGYAIINAKDSIMPSMVGTLASMLTKSNEFDDRTFVMAMAREKENKTKVSLRIAGRKNNIDLTEVIRKVVEKAGGEAGGHMNAAGAVIKTKDEKAFIEAAKMVFWKMK